MGYYAQDTTVTWEKSRDEIEQVLKRYRCTHFAYMTMPNAVMIAFVRDGVPYRIEVPLPKPTEKVVMVKPNGNPRPESQRAKAIEQEQRRRWRVLLLLIKARLEWVSLGMSNMAEQFLPDVALPNGETLGKYAAAQVQKAIADGKMPQNILALPANT